MAEKILAVENLTKIYDGERAVDGISFLVEAGEIVGLLGPNGAGKTSTISMILGILEPTAGNITIFGKNLVRERSQILSQVNFAATYSQLPGNLSVRQNLFIFAMLYGVAMPKRKVAELMQEFELEKFSKIRTGFLSSGEQSRLNIAKALMNKPRLLLLDEPTASIDPSTADILRNRIKSYIAGSGAAALWTSHNMSEIEAMCDRVLLISHGKVILEGNPRELPRKHGKKNLEELFIAVAREPLSLHYS